MPSGSVSADPVLSDDVWREQDTTPSAIESALRELLKRRHAEKASFVPARVCNLVVVVDRAWRGEVQNRLERVGRYHPSRTILCAVEAGRTSLDAWATMSAEPTEGDICLAHEHVEIEIGPSHLPHLDTIVDPLLVTDLSTVVWSPHGHDEAVDSLVAHAQVVLLDSVDDPDIERALGRAANLADRAYVVDLAWLRSTPWRERISASFDPRPLRPLLRSISGVTIRHHPDSAAAALLLVGWLATRLGWEVGTATRHGDRWHAKAHARRQDVAIGLQPAPEQSVRGLAGVTIETAGGMSLSLDRGAGGLRAVRRDRAGRLQEWTILGASRGEAGILGEGVRQALLRDHTYRPALAAASAMAA